MSALRILLFGSAEDLASPFVESLKHVFKAGVIGSNFELVMRDKVPPPSRDQKGTFHAVILVWQSADKVQLTPWINWCKTLKPQPKLGLYALAETIPSWIGESFSPIIVVQNSESADRFVTALSNDPPKKDGPKVAMPPPPKASKLSSLNDDALAELSLSLTDASAAGRELPPVESPSVKLPEADAQDEAIPLVVDVDGLDALREVVPKDGTNNPPNIHAEAGASFENDLSLDLPDFGAGSGLSVKNHEATQISDGPNPQAADMGLGEAFDSISLEAGHEPGPAAMEPVAGENSAVGVDGLWVESKTGLQEPVVESIGLGNAEESVRFEAQDRIVASSLSKAAGSEEYQTLQRYAALKEREAREKDGAIQALNRQLEQIRERLSKSEGERRRLTMALNDSEVTRRSLEDDRDQAKNHVTKIEAAQLEEMRAFQLRLDNAQFQASRAEKKLEDFRERVRTDIQKIRMRERELANRLELQKRDAEALLAAKDERLLQHKREIDRLEFEVETLRERLVEQTQKAEDRVSRVSRAQRAIKMAQGMLSGIEDEVLPTAEGSSDEGEEAA